MRRTAVAVGAAALALAFAGTPALADPTPAPNGSPSVPAAKPAEKVCTITDTRNKLFELSGMITTANGYAVINDGSDGQLPVKVYFLSATCGVTSVWTDTSGITNTRDTEDMAIAPDGTIWVGDIGDNDENRDKGVVLWKLPANATTASNGKATMYRLRYADKPHDAEALVIAGDGTPVIVTKGRSGGVGVYVPSGPLEANKTGELKRVGDFKTAHTGTSGGPVGPLSGSFVTGGANSPDGKRVALRTYTDAYEWDVTGGDVAGAITKGQPRITPLKDEPFGESIAYTRDGKYFATVDETTSLPAEVKPEIRRYEPSPPAPPKSAASAPPAKKGDQRSWLDKLTIRDITLIVAGVGVLGGLMVMIGVIGIRRARKRRRLAAAAKPARGRARPGGPDDQPTGATQLPPVSPGSARPTPSGRAQAAGRARPPATGTARARVPSNGPTNGPSPGQGRARVSSGGTRPDDVIDFGPRDDPPNAPRRR